MRVVLMTFAILAWVIGLLTLSQATTGVGAIGSACFLAILVRLVEAGSQHKELLAAIGTLRQRTP
jgi:hypothetical protein